MTSPRKFICAVDFKAARDPNRELRDDKICIVLPSRGGPFSKSADDTIVTHAEKHGLRAEWADEYQGWVVTRMR